MIYRVSGGVLDFYLFLGPEPDNVVQQYTQVKYFWPLRLNMHLYLFFLKYFGRPFMPPYWALGFQISRYGYKDLQDMKNVLDRFKKNDIPLVIKLSVMNIDKP